MEMPVAIDANALTYLIEAMDPAYDPNSDDPALAQERISMLRAFFYVGISFHVLPQVKSEYMCISKIDWRELHDHIKEALLTEVDWNLDPQTMLCKKNLFMSFHNKEKDCQVLAEAEAANMTTLLTRDDKFIQRLASATTVHIVYPSEFWQSQNMRAGSDPKWEPSPSNPLHGKNWWRV